MLAAATIMRWPRPFGLANDSCGDHDCRKKLKLENSLLDQDPEDRPLALVFSLLSDASRHILGNCIPSALIPPACPTTKGSTAVCGCFFDYEETEPL